MMDFEVTISEQSYKLTKSADGLMLDDKSIDYQYFQLGPGRMLILYNDKPFEVELLSQPGKSMQMSINGKVTNVDVKDHLDQLLEKLGMDAGDDSRIDEVVSPMPGLILDIMVSEGDEVKKGDPLLILEAMKMENIITSPSDGLIQKIHVNKGDNVNKSQTLIGF